MKAVPGIPTLAGLGAFARLFEFRAVSRWVGLGLVAGVFSGLAAALFFMGMDLLRQLLLVRLGGFPLLEPAGEHSLFASQPSSVFRPWVIVLSPACGALVAHLLAKRFTSRPFQGTDAMVDAFHTQDGRIPARESFMKALGAVLVIGSGGSAGREGPMAHLGAGIGSLLSRGFGLSARERRLLLLAGAAGGVGAIFRTPLGAALFIVEVLYKDDFEVDGLVPTVLSSVVAYSVFTMLFGEGQIFATEGHYDFDPRQLPLYLLMAIGAAIVGVAFIKAFFATREFFARVRLPSAAKPFLGGLLVGALALIAPQALGTGYGVLQQGILPPQNAQPVGYVGAVLLLGVALLKVVSTCLTVGSGGAGGVFGPSVVIGGMVGGAFGHGFHLLVPEVVTQPGAFVIVGMACFVGGVAHAPISTLVMASELTGSYDLLVPIMLAEVVTVTLMQRFTLFPTQVATRRDSPAHGAEYVMDLLAQLRVGDVYDASATVEPVPAATPLTKLLRHASGSTKAVFQVVGENGETLGLVTMDTLRAFFFDEELARIAVAVDCVLPFVSVRVDDRLDVALERFASSHYPELPVVDDADPERILGLLNYEDVLRAYRRELVRQRLSAEGQTASSPQP